VKINEKQSYQALYSQTPHSQIPIVSVAKTGIVYQENE